MPWNDGLTGSTLAIASYAGTPLHVLAGPGTGKTFSLMRRVARYIEAGTSPSRILAVTFTRIAANDLLINLHQLGVEGCDEVRSMTLHALCFHILSRNEVLLITGRTPRPLLKHEISCLLYDLPIRYGVKREKQKLLDSFTAAWARLQTDEPGWPASQLERDFQNDLLAWLRFHKAILIGELVPLTLSYIKNNPTCPERTLFDVVLADEYQDLNRSEQKIIDLLASSSNLTVVGDDDQSIYQFMKFAHPEGIIDFPLEHANSMQKTLDECLRCPTLVVEMADTLIHHNTNRSQRDLRPRAGNPRGQVNIVQWNDLEAEAAGVCTYVCHLIDNLQITEKDILVLCPRRLLGYKIRDSIRNAGKRVRSCFSEDALDRDRAKRQFILLNLLAYPNDLPALRSWLGIGVQNKRTRAYNRLREYCDRSALSPFDALAHLSQGNVDLPYVSTLVDRWNELQRELDVLNGMTPQEVIDTLFPEGEDDLDELRLLSATAFSTNNNIPHIFEFIKAQIAHPELPEVEDSVRVMSLHKSKGLTAKAVIVTGCIEGWLPQIDQDLSRTQQDRQLEEARRLFFVALTRTTNVLLICNSLYIDYRTASRTGAKYSRAGSQAKTLASRFIQELGRTSPDPISGEDFLR
jgi:DNA helicase II / ATP-dependent DNA helicase PcrA